jgi:hypothetical protein
MWFFQKKPKQQDEVLRPGNCECGHIRCCHRKGVGRCNVEYPVYDGWPYGGNCACDIYIRAKDNDPYVEPETPTPSELEKLYNR